MSRPRAKNDAACPPPDPRQPYFEALFAAMDDGLCFLDRDLRLVAANAAMRRLAPGKDFDQPQACQAASPDAAGLCGRCAAATALETGQTMVRRVDEIAPDGGARHLEAVCRPLADAAGSIFGVAEVVRDVSRRDAAEREMSLATRDIEMLLASIRSILVSLDGQNRIRRFNASAEAAFGLTANAVAGRDFFDLGLAFDGQDLRAAVKESRRTQTPVRVDEVRCRTPDMAERLLGLTINPVPAPPGEAAGVLLLGQDLTEIKARELKAVHERRMQAIGRLASGIAHEINTPVQYVGYNAGFLDGAFADLLGLLDAYARLAEAVRAGDAAAMAEAAAETAKLA
ncbi:MAG: PAS domain-containing protein, partial [Acidobacteriota bacterium]